MWLLLKLEIKYTKGWAQSRCLISDTIIRHFILSLPTLFMGEIGVNLGQLQFEPSKTRKKCGVINYWPKQPGT